MIIGLETQFLVFLRVAFLHMFYCINILDDVWRVLEVSEFLKQFNSRIYLTIDDALNAVSIETQMQQVPEKQVSIHLA